MQAIVEAIHAAPVKLSLTICGAGATVVSMLTEVEGCSQTLIQADTLYARSATTYALDYNPRHVVSQAVAAQLAQSAYRRSFCHQKQSMMRSGRAQPPAMHMSVCSEAAYRVIGVGATSAIRTNRTRRGKDHAFVCVWEEEKNRSGLPGSVDDRSCSSSSKPNGSSTCCCSGDASERVICQDNSTDPCHSVCCDTGACHGGGDSHLGNEVAHCDECRSLQLRERSTPPQIHHYYLELDKSWDRVRQEREVALLILHAIAEYTMYIIAVPSSSLSSSTTHPGIRAASEHFGQSKEHHTNLCGTHCMSQAVSISEATCTSTAAATPSATTTAKAARHSPYHALRTYSALQLLTSAPSHEYVPFTVSTGSVERLVQCVLDKELDVVIWNRYGDVRTEQAPYFLEEEEEEQEEEGSVRRVPRGSIVNPKSNTMHEDVTPSRHATAELVQHVAATALPAEGPHIVRLLYPGSFNPLHWGHTELARAAVAVVAKRYQQQQGAASSISIRGSSSSSDILLAECRPIVSVTYEIACQIVGKGGLTAAKIAPRVAQLLARHERVAVTRARLFVEKAQLFPRHGFIIGLDTARRVLDPSYYQPATEEGMVMALRSQIGARGCFFVVGGRQRQTRSDELPSSALDSNRSIISTTADKDSYQVWESLSTLSVPVAVRDLFVPIAESDFRVDISSTELRARAQS